MSDADGDNRRRFGCVKCYDPNAWEKLVLVNKKVGSPNKSSKHVDMKTGEYDLGKKKRITDRSNRNKSLKVR